VKILIVADLHFNLPQLDWLLGVSADFDALVIAGDLLDIAGRLEIDSQILIVEEYLKRLSDEGPVLVCSGNHDGDEITSNEEWVANWIRRAGGGRIVVDGDSLQMGTTCLTSLPWWDGPETRAEMEATLAKAEAQRGDCWIWVHHAPPMESPVSWTGKKDAGDPVLRKWIHHYQPDYVFSGHIHNAPFRSGGGWHDQIGKTRIFNAGMQIGPVPAFISMCLESGEAEWISLAGAETLRFLGEGI
jgi:Icc-related predicted phosphoesterase